MNTRFRAPISAAIAISIGIVILLGYFFGENAAGQSTTLGILRTYFLQGAITLAGVAILVGVGNLVSVHLKKIRTSKGSGYSFVLLIALLLTLAIGLYDIFNNYQQGTPIYKNTSWLFEHIQLPIETSLMAILAVSLTYAVARLLRQRLNLLSGVFVAVVLILLLGTLPQLTASLPFLLELRAWIVEIPAVGGARGILLGVALGTIATGIRILMGSDRPYSG